MYIYIITESWLNKDWKSKISSSLSSSPKIMAQALVQESQWSETEPFGLSATLNNLENLHSKEILLIQGCWKKRILLPPKLKSANASILHNCLKILIQRLLRLKVYFPLVCQSKVLLPWMLLITWYHSQFCSNKKRQPH